MTDLFIKEIWQYPIKGCAGQRVDSIEVGQYFGHDREWLVVDETGMFVAQRGEGGKGVGHRQLALVQPLVKDGYMSVNAPCMPPLFVPLHKSDMKECEAQVWDWRGKAFEVGGACPGWFTEYLNRFEAEGQKRSYRLVQVHRHEPRKREAKGSIFDLSFADGYPILAISQASLDHLNSKIEGEPVGMDRFRPNLVIDGDDTPHFEDSIDMLQSDGGIILRGRKTCDRCQVPAIRQEDAGVDSRPLQALAQYRYWKDDKGKPKVWFGMNFTHHLSGSLQVGDALTRI